MEKISTKSAVIPISLTCNQSMRKILVVTHGAKSNGHTVPLFCIILWMHSPWVIAFSLDRHDALLSTSLTCGQGASNPIGTACLYVPAHGHYRSEALLTYR